MKCSSVLIHIPGALLAGDLTLPSLPSPARGLVVLVHGPDQARYGRDDRELASRLEDAGLATLRVDLLTRDEQDAPPHASMHADAHLHAHRLTAVIEWTQSEPLVRELGLGLLGSGAGASVVLQAAAQLPDLVRAVVVRGDHANLAATTPPSLSVPVLFIVGAGDREGLALSRLAVQAVPGARLEVVPDPWHSIDEPHGREEVARLAITFFVEKLVNRASLASGTWPSPSEQPPIFLHRQHAGAQLAAQLSRYAGRSDVIILAIPHGGVQVGVEVARALGAPLDVIVTRRLCAPGMQQLALGSVGPDGVLVCDHELAPRFSPADMSAEITRQRRALQLSERALRGQRPPPEVNGKTVLLVDDGMITGASMRAAVAWARVHLAARVVVAVPVAPAQAVKQVAEEADEVICLAPPIDFTSVSACYVDFPRPDVGEVAAQLAMARVEIQPYVDPIRPSTDAPTSAH